ncbi:TonB system transport protein ExbD [Novosphingobium sp. FSY-8]|uniref:Biopolymer transport protein ExbD n=1 Tax=Novosphingobium ovatum TaxID=1908523 RepID=A0ABW9XES5_9SPHN|nr:TonB system transport protein ExbD [Novosphingobium ovatum]NBC37016.1 TonB system transport protein ExbD [Novosphingobium ovatum]
MAFRFNASDDGDLPVNHDINVTPFIDVMLVLLIIFMVAAPLATVDIKVDLPVANAQPAPRPDKPVYLTIREDGSTLVNEQVVPVAAIGAQVRQVTGLSSPDGQRVFLRADRKVPYEKIIEAMNALRAAGYLQIALVGLEGGAAQ